MVKRWLPTLAALTLLASCADAPDAAAAADYYGALDNVVIEAEITSSTDILIDYTVLFVRKNGEDTVTILAPESVAGITARIGGGRASLEYDDLALETLLPDIPGFAPVDALNQILRDLADGAYETWGEARLESGPALALTFVGDADGVETSKTVWLDRSDRRLLRAELYLDGALTLTVSVISFVS